MLPNDYQEAATRRAVILLLALQGATYESGRILSMLIENRVFAFIVMLCFFGALVPLVNAKANQDDRWFNKIYSAFYSFLITSIIAAWAYYGANANQYAVMLGGSLLGAVMGNILHKFFAQINDTPDFLSIFKLLAAIATAVWNVIRAANNETTTHRENEDDSTKNEL